MDYMYKDHFISLFSMIDLFIKIKKFKYIDVIILIKRKLYLNSSVDKKNMCIK